MFKTFREKIALSGITVLMIGVALLVFTFISAYGFLTQNLSIMASEDLVRTFGEALAPLIETCVRIMYLGVMGWVGSLLTIRGVTIIAHTPQVTPIVQQKEAMPEQKPQPQPQPQKAKAEKPKAEKPKEEVKPQEPEMVVIPPEQVSQPQPQPKEPEKNASPQ
ncbi:MAG: hypothetical protein QME50_03880 [Candidatus Bathyarchaeota archaeon]|nr:hypothetical protein [Candidatus Bathyarchaeota archaeon]MDI6805902.1 hypothetical protein [Candidatus Bathyarchaeia archaeon]